MNKYLLLRDNKQTGPHSLQEIQEMGLKSYDLIWVEGKSAAWRYSGEIEEMKSFAPQVEEQPFDRFFKRPMREEHQAQQAELPKKIKEEQLESKRQLRQFPAEEKKEPVVKETIQEKRQPAPLAPQEQRKPQKKYVSISMPARRDGTGQQALSGKKSVPASSATTAATFTEASNILTPGLTPNPDSLSEASYTSAPGSVHSGGSINYAPATKIKAADNLFNHQNYQPIYPGQSTHFKPAFNWIRHNQQALLQYAGVSLALSSLLMIGVLIGQSMNTDPVKPYVPKSTNQPAVPSTVATERSVKNPALVSIPTSNDITQDMVDEGVSPERINKNIVEATPAKKLVKHASAANVPSEIDKISENKGTGTSADEKDKIDKNPSSTSAEPGKNLKPTSLSSEVTVKLNDYKINMFGGIDNISVTVNNSSSFPIDLVVVEVDYIQSNKKVYKTETLRLKNIASGASATAEAPKTNRGIKLNSRITYITSTKAGISENL